MNTKNKYSVPCGIAIEPELVVPFEFDLLPYVGLPQLKWEEAGIDYIVFYDQELFRAFVDRYVKGNKDNYIWVDWVRDSYPYPDCSQRAAIKIVGCSQEYTTEDLMALEFGYQDFTNNKGENNG